MDFVSIKYIMDRLTRHPLLQDIPFEIVVDYAADFIKLVGMPPVFIDKIAEIPIKEYRGELPCDFYEMIQVRPLLPCGDKQNIAFRYTTDSFHLSKHRPELTDWTYKIQGRVIFTSIEEGTIEISYRAMPIDDDGYPMIPDNTSFTKALEAYIKKQWFTIQFDLGKINANIMNKADQDYAWYVGQCSSDLIRPTLDQMESFSNMWNTLLVRADEHRHGYLHEGTKERIRTH